MRRQPARLRSGARCASAASTSGGVILAYHTNGIIVEKTPKSSHTELSRWRGSGRQGLPEILCFQPISWLRQLMGWKQKALGGLAALQTSRRESLGANPVVDRIKET